MSSRDQDHLLRDRSCCCDITLYSYLSFCYRFVFMREPVRYILTAGPPSVYCDGVRKRNAKRPARRKNIEPFVATSLYPPTSGGFQFHAVLDCGSLLSRVLEWHTVHQIRFLGTSVECAVKTDTVGAYVKDSKKCWDSVDVFQSCDVAES